MRCIPVGQGGQDIGLRATVAVEQLLRPVGAEPRLEDGEMLGVRLGVLGRHLVSAERPFNRHAVDLDWPSPPFGAAQQQHRPLPSFGGAGTRLALDRANCLVGLIHRLGHHRVRIVRGADVDDVRSVAVAGEQVGQLRIGHRGEDGRRGDLEAVQVQDRQDRARGSRVEELGAVPRGGGRTGLRLAVADDAGDDQVRIVEGRAERRRQRIAQLAPSWMVPGTGGLR